jgi:TetR/AcrR family transcriptional regulator, cholesterol catabolism regulator
MAATSRPKRANLGARWDRRRDELIAGAARVFAERGYERTSVAELAERLGLATGALYHYFAGKEELLVGICDQLMEPLLERAAALLGSAADGDSAAPDAGRLRALVRLWVEHVAAHREHLLVFNQVRHLVDHGPGWRGVREARKRFENLLGATLATETGENGVPHRLRLAALLGMVNHTPNWYRPGGALSPHRIADGYVDLVLAPG